MTNDKGNKTPLKLAIPQVKTQGCNSFGENT